MRRSGGGGSDVQTDFSLAIYQNQRFGFGARLHDSEKVVSAIQDAIQTVVKESQASELVLIGYSGGGTLAMLAAARIPQTRAVVTLAGNLEQWPDALVNMDKRLFGSQ